MDKFMDKLQEVLLPISGKLAANKTLNGISRGFSSILPVIMVGSIFTLLSSFNITVYQNFITSIGLKPILAIPASYTTDMLAVYASFSIARALSAELGMDNTDSIADGIISLITFLILIPLGVSGKTDAGEVVKVSAALNTSYLGAKGLFTAMIVGCVVPRLHNIFIKYNITIKLPDSVPPAIAKSFASILPAIAIAFVAAIVRTIMAATSYGTLTDCVYTLLRAPLAALTDSPFTFMLMLMICSVMWFIGIHGGQIVNPMRLALYTEGSLANLAAYGAGEALPNIVVNTAWFGIGNIGGSACAIGLCVCLALFSKSKRYKGFAKVACPAGFCAITEPMVFGIPLVLNPIMFIPMVVAPGVTFLLGYLAMKVGLVPFMTGVDIPTGTPVILSGFLAFGSIRGAILQIVLIIVSTCIYYPFFRVLDKQALDEESAAEAQK